MALPKRRKSAARVRTRRANWKAAPVAKTTCSHCGVASVPHRVCMACGYYNGRQILTPRSKAAQLPESDQ